MSNLFEYLAIPTGRPAPPPELAALPSEQEEGVRFEDVGFRYPGARGLGAAAGLALHPPRAEPGAGRAERRGQDDAHQAAHPAVRADRGAHPARRARPPELGRGDAPPPHRRHLPGLQPVPAPRSARTSGFGSVEHADDVARLERAVGRGGADEVLRDAARRAGDAARPLVQGGRRALRRAVAEGGAGPGVHARGGGHPGPRRADRGARRRGRARHLRALPRSSPTGAPRSSSRTASPTVRMADRIVVIEQGKIVEQGTHEELMAARRPLRAPLHPAGEGLPVSVRAACLDLLSALLDSWAVWDAVAASLGRAELGRTWRGRYLEITSTGAVTVRTSRWWRRRRARSACHRRPPAAGACRGTCSGPGRTCAPALAALQLSHRRGHQLLAVLGRRAAACGWASGSTRWSPPRRPARTSRTLRRTVSPARGSGACAAEVALSPARPSMRSERSRYGFRVTWVNRLGAAVPPELDAARVTRSLSGWTP